MIGWVATDILWRGQPVFFNERTDDLAVEVMGERLVALPPSVEQQVRVSIEPLQIIVPFDQILNNGNSNDLTRRAH